MSVLGRGLVGSLVSGWDMLRGSYWFLPMLMAGVAASLALGLVDLDAWMEGSAARRIPWIQDAGPEGTRALLSTVAGSMITVTGVVFSTTVVALTLASSQFGPRLLRNFLRDRGNQLVLGTFVSTFLYSLLVLRAVDSDHVPHLATTVALALAVTSVFVLIYFVHHVASSIQATSIIASVAKEIEAQLPKLFPEPLGAEAPADEHSALPPRPDPADERCVASRAGGYVRVLDSDGLFQLAVDRDIRIELAARPGDFVADGDPLARVSPAERCDDELETCVCESFVIGTHRTAVQDLAFLTDQLAEMAVRALSPGINDPKSAIACVHRIGAVIAAVGSREMPRGAHYDADGNLRVVAPATRFGDVVASCLDPIRRYGVADGEVVEAALEALAAAAGRCPDASRRDLLLEHAREWFDGYGEAGAHSKRDRERVDRAFDRVRAATHPTLP